MRRVVVLAILALMVVSTAAWADTITIVNKGGLLSMSNAGIVSTSSHLHQFNNIIAPPGGGLGFVNFSTGALVSGSIQAGGIFSSSGSSFVVRSTSGQLPCHACILFNGTFTGDITWTLVSQQGGESVYQLSGTLVGQLWNGRTVTGSTVQNVTTFNQQLRQGVGHLRLGDTNLGTPEPSSLMLLGTGLIGIGGFVRRKLVS
jgi:PEP-CTERM motif